MGKRREKRMTENKVHSGPEMDVIAGLLFVIDWLGDYVEDPDGHDSHVDYLLNQKWQHEFLPMKNSEHCGDCTKACHTCIRCEMDELYRKAKELLACFQSIEPKYVKVKKDDLKEILRITDRKAPLWDRLKASLEGENK